MSSSDSSGEGSGNIARSQPILSNALVLAAPELEAQWWQQQQAGATAAWLLLAPLTFSALAALLSVIQPPHPPQWQAAAMHTLLLAVSAAQLASALRRRSASRGEKALPVAVAGRLVRTAIVGEQSSSATTRRCKRHL